jgi:glyoxylase-like metal-dependent hydrolase (beta-lactamase superfamily II)
MPGFVMRDFTGTVNALKGKNVSPEEITDVIITHAHHDHIECVKYFENALIHIQKDEYEKGKKYIPDNFKVNLFTDEFTLCGKVKIIKISVKIDILYLIFSIYPL